ncbi:MAG TPA: ABC transporter substrate-binding protein [Spirochaetia bacterium]|nr:ABC transporter substrate-binding protein [Spirochaetia bacterium]
MKRLLSVFVALVLAVGFLFAGGTKEAPGPGTVGGLASVPRNRTLVTSGWDYYSQVPTPDNMSPYTGATGLNRNILSNSVFEGLFYANLMTGKIEPWMAESYSYNSDYTQVTVNLRHDVVWSDGQPFTSADVVFTGDMLMANAPLMTYAAQFKADVAKVEAQGPYVVVFTLTHPNSRWARDELAYNLGQPARFVIVPKHVWEGQDAKKFTDLDLAKGWPVGTGPYKLVYNSNNELVFDLRTDWWAAKAGLVPLPKVQRIIYRPSTSEGTPQLYISNQVDLGRSLPAGAFEAAKNQNPDLVSWNNQGPVWGAPDGCEYRLTFNNQKAPFDNPQLHWAINYALDRQQIVKLAYENSTTIAVAPLSTYGEVQKYVKELKSLFDKYNVNDHDLTKVNDIMTKLGYTKDSAGMWQGPSGAPFKPVITSGSGDPAGPVIVQQLRNAGFDASLNVEQDAAFIQDATSGNFEMHLWVHCGSAYDPYQTLEHYSSKYVAPVGQQVSSLRAYTRYSNPKLDAVLAKMAQMVPSPDNPQYVSLVSEALGYYFQDLPDITIAAETQVIVFNTKYWKGWPTAENPYMHPFIPWEGFGRVIETIQPTQ